MLEILKEWQSVLSAISIGGVVLLQLSRQHREHRIELAEFKRSQEARRQEHREDMKEHRMEVSQALQTLAAHAVKINNLEPKSNK